MKSATVFTLVVFLLLGASTATAGVITLDQKYEPTSPSTVAISPTTGITIAQTFTVGLAGDLAKADVRITSQTTNVGKFHLNIVQTQIAGCIIARVAPG